MRIEGELRGGGVGGELRNSQVKLMWVGGGGCRGQTLILLLMSWSWSLQELVNFNCFIVLIPVRFYSLK